MTGRYKASSCWESAEPPLPGALPSKPQPPHTDRNNSRAGQTAGARHKDGVFTLWLVHDSLGCALRCCHSGQSRSPGPSQPSHTRERGPLHRLGGRELTPPRPTPLSWALTAVGQFHGLKTGQWIPSRARLRSMPCPGRLGLGPRDGDGWGGELVFLVHLETAPRAGNKVHASCPP